MTRTIKVSNVATSFIVEGDTIQFTYKGQLWIGVVGVMDNKYCKILTQDGWRTFRYGWMGNCEYICKPVKK